MSLLCLLVCLYSMCKSLYKKKRKYLISVSVMQIATCDSPPFLSIWATSSNPNQRKATRKSQNTKAPFLCVVFQESAQKRPEPLEHLPHFTCPQKRPVMLFSCYSTDLLYQVNGHVIGNATLTDVANSSSLIQTLTQKEVVYELLCCEKCLTFGNNLSCCGPYSYNSYHVFSHIAITEDQEEDEEGEDYMAYVHLSSVLDG